MFGGKFKASSTSSHFAAKKKKKRVSKERDQGRQVQQPPQPPLHTQNFVDASLSVAALKASARASGGGTWPRTRGGPVIEQVGTMIKFNYKSSLL
jgi:hypothetical protein